MNSFISTLLASSYAWGEAHLLKVVGIIVIATIVVVISDAVIARVIRKIISRGRHSKEAEEKRENTLIQVIRGTSRVLISIMAILMVLSEFGIAIGPILAAAGVAGIAIGFGGQYLIRDLISGMFIIIENQYRTGDVVCFGDTCGAVEEITLRMTTLRDMDGTVHHVPHGEVTKVSNLSKYFSRVNLDVGVSYSVDLEKVIRVVNEVGLALAEDLEWKDRIVSPPLFLRVEDFADSAVMIKILGDTKPQEQWAVTGELRKRLKIAFDAEGIEIPFPQRVLHKA
ncbi:mechanosensitive ion channel family protein [Patescibacteria group bacterium]|nr:mechanosensitive ion channel family protein [Patescibacteria group bacterium]MBU1754720.1 mechanosensitive ion channel family protein [Patescibacteria group bacterium]